MAVDSHMMPDTEENDANTLLSGTHGTMESRTRHDEQCNGGLSKYFRSLWTAGEHSRAKSPVSLLSRPDSPEEAPLLQSSGSRSALIGRTGTKHPIKTQRARETPPRINLSHGHLSKRSSMLSCLFLAVLTLFLSFGARILFSFRYSDLTDDQYCVNSIFFAANAFKFSDAPPDGAFWGAVCQSKLKLITMYASAKTYCDPGHIEPGLQAVKSDCLGKGYEMLDLGPIAAMVTTEYISGLRVMGERFPVKLVLEEPVLIAKPFFDRVFKTIDTWYWTMETHHAYGFALEAFWGVVILFGIVNNIWSSFVSRRNFAPGYDIEGLSMGKQSSSVFPAPFAHFAHWCRAHIGMPAAVGTYHQRLFYWCTIPSRFDSIVVCSFWILSITLACVSYRPFAENYFWDTTGEQMCRYIADRTGIMSYATLPLIWIFATRNNGFLWATGWSSRTFNIYHRHVARVGTLLGIAHSVAYSYDYLQYQSWARYKRAMGKQWIFLGAMATVTMSFLLLFSHAWIRVKFYETFLMLHIALSVMTLVGLFYHTSRFAGYESYLWPVAAAWLIDRLLRLFRMVYINYRVRFSRGGTLQVTETIATYNEESDVIRLEITPAAGSGTMPAPGQFYYIYQPSTWTGWENHPFTVGAWSSSSPSSNTLDTVGDQGGEFVEEDKGIFPSSSLVSSSSASSSSSSRLLDPQNSLSKEQQETQEEPVTVAGRVMKGNPALTFFIRPYTGWTKTLKNQILRSSSHASSSSPPSLAPAYFPVLLLEGPYGHSYPLHSYSTVLLLAGGTGIAGVVPYILSHIDLCSSPQQQQCEDRRTESRARPDNNEGSSKLTSRENRGRRTRTQTQRMKL